MIEIPKYSVSTFDPHSSAINQRSDFTRRIPTGRRVKERQVEREEVFAYVSRRSEQEIIIL